MKKTIFLTLVLLTGLFLVQPVHAGVRAITKKPLFGWLYLPELAIISGYEFKDGQVQNRFDRCNPCSFYLEMYDEEKYFEDLKFDFSIFGGSYYENGCVPLESGSPQQNCQRYGYDDVETRCCADAYCKSYERWCFRETPCNSGRTIVKVSDKVIWDSTINDEKTDNLANVVNPLNPSIGRDCATEDCPHIFINFQAQGEYGCGGFEVSEGPTVKTYATVTTTVVTTSTVGPTTTILTECSSDDDCFWCGDVCRLWEPDLVCPTVMPPENMDCICQNNECTEIEIPEPKQSIIDLFPILKLLWDWLKDIFSKLPFSIVGETSVQPGTHNYTITVETTEIDEDCSDGFCQVQFGAWALYDSDLNPLIYSSWEQCGNVYMREVSLTLNNIGDYALVATIIKYDMIYNETWTYSTEEVTGYEGIKIKVSPEAPIIPIPPEERGWFQGVIVIFEELKSWFCSWFPWC